MGKMMLIVNPNSGKGGMRLHLQDIITLFHENGWEVTVFPTHKSGDATRYLLERYLDFDIAVCCGGDGTLNECIAGLMQLPVAPKLGYIPVGTSNDLASNLNLSKKPLLAAKEILNMQEFSYDVGLMNDCYFSYVAAFGTFSNISYSTPQTMKRTLGKAAYVLEAVRNISDIKPHHAKITMDGTTIEGDYSVCAVMNSYSFGGLFHLKKQDVDLSDGKFEILLIRPPKNPMQVKQMMDQLISHSYHAEDIQLYHASEIQIETDVEMPWCVDGESAGTYQCVQIHPCEKKMTIYANQASR